MKLDKINSMQFMGKLNKPYLRKEDGLGRHIGYNLAQNDENGDSFISSTTKAPEEQRKAIAQAPQKYGLLKREIENYADREFRKKISTDTYIDEHGDDIQRFNDNEIQKLIEMRTPENAELMDELIGRTYPGSSRRYSETYGWELQMPRFDYIDIQELIKIRTPYDTNFMDKLIKDIGIYGKPRFDGYDIRELTEAHTPENDKFMNKLLKATTYMYEKRNGEYSYGRVMPRFRSREIQKLVETRTPDNAEFMDKLLNDTYTDENRNDIARFNSADIIKLVETRTPENSEFMDKLLRDTHIDENGNVIPRFDSNTIKRLAKKSNNAEFINKLIMTTMTTEYGNTTLRFNDEDIQKLAEIRTQDNAEFMDKLLSETKANKNGYIVPRFDGWEIEELVKTRTPDNSEFMDKLLRDTNANENGDTIPRFQWYDIQKLAEIRTPKNANLMDELVNSNVPRFSGWDIAELIKACALEDTELIDNVMKYAKTIDFKELTQIVPEIKDFLPEQYLTFLKYHYQNGTTEFTRDSLTLDKDFTGYLTRNYVDADKLTELLSIYPATDRKVGSIPQDWTKEGLSQKEQEKIKNEIYSQIEDFKKTKDIDEFSSEMSKILGKKVDVKEIGSGYFGNCYKISMDGAKDLCLKLFYDLRRNKEHFKNIYGPHVETQAGLFANNHSNDFVKMYFGKVAPIGYSDGFLVTQYLSKNSIPEENPNIQDGYDIKNNDATIDHNMIGDKIIDFGGTQITKINS